MYSESDADDGDRRTPSFLLIDLAAVRMSRNLIVEFSKMQGTGNDFVVIDNRFLHFTRGELSDIARKVCRRKLGVGADGLLAFEAAPDDVSLDDAATKGEASHVDFRMVYVNADGSPATMCGNGARCIAQFAVRSGVDGPDVSFVTDAGVYQAHVYSAAHAADSDPDEPGGRVRLFVPEPERWTESCSLDASLPGGVDNVHFVWTGTEHLVTLVPDVDDVPLEEWGPLLRWDTALQPEGANLNVVSSANGEEELIRVRTFEKGVEAETLACGTGVLASAVAIAKLRDLDLAIRPLHVETRGGTMTVGRATSRERSDHLYLEGPVASVFRGTFEWSGLDESA